MVFFETTPTGRILNRFTSDTEMLDSMLLQTMQQWLNCIFPVLSTAVLVTVVLYWSVLWLLPMFGLYVLIYRYTVSATRDLKRVEAISRSPIFSQFTETLSGLSTIRAFRAAGRYARESERLIDENMRCCLSQYKLQAFLTARLDLMSASIVFVAALL